MATVVRKTLKELGQMLGGDVSPLCECTITGIAGLEVAKKGELSYVLHEKYMPKVALSAASALIVPRQFPTVERPCVRVDNVHHAVEMVKSVFHPAMPFAPGIHPSAVIGKDVEIGANVSIMANVVVQDGAKIGDGTVLYPGVYVGHESVVGKSCIVYPNCVIREHVVIGDRVILQPGAVIGAD
ncbi:MAG: LpxD N-terminal domain-containing protein [Planctomycetota bacterium]